MSACLSLAACAWMGMAGLTAGLHSQALLRGGLSGSSVVSLKGGSCSSNETPQSPWTQGPSHDLFLIDHAPCDPASKGEVSAGGDMPAARAASRACGLGLWREHLGSGV